MPVGSGAPGGVTPAAPGNHAADGGPPGSLKRIWSELEADHGASLTMLQGQMELIRELEKEETELGQLEETMASDDLRMLNKQRKIWKKICDFRYHVDLELCETQRELRELTARLLERQIH